VSVLHGPAQWRAPCITFPGSRNTSGRFVARRWTVGWTAQNRKTPRIYRAVDGWTTQNRGKPTCLDERQSVLFGGLKIGPAQIVNGKLSHLTARLRYVTGHVTA
jgi:hypothetical protein